jgi:hypothetical protein
MGKEQETAAKAPGEKGRRTTCGTALGTAVKEDILTSSEGN